MKVPVLITIFSFSNEQNLYHTPDYVAPPPREKTHECSDCHKTFAHRGNLLRHMALHDPDNPESREMLRQADELEAGEEEHNANMMGEVANITDLAGVMAAAGDGQEVTYVQVGGQLIQVNLINIIFLLCLAKWISHSNYMCSSTPCDLFAHIHAKYFE